MDIEREITMPDGTAEGPEGNDPLTTSTLREVLGEVKKRGVNKEDLRKHPELREEIVGADGRPAFKNSDIPKVEPKGNPVLSMDGVVSPEKAHWVDDHAQAVVGKKEEPPPIPVQLAKTDEKPPAPRVRRYFPTEEDLRRLNKVMGGKNGPIMQPPDNPGKDNNPNKPT